MKWLTMDTEPNVVHQTQSWLSYLKTRKKQMVFSVPKVTFELRITQISPQKTLTAINMRMMTAKRSPLCQ